MQSVKDTETLYNSKKYKHYISLFVFCVYSHETEMSVFFFFFSLNLFKNLLFLEKIYFSNDTFIKQYAILFFIWIFFYRLRWEQIDGSCSEICFISLHITLLNSNSERSCFSWSYCWKEKWNKFILHQYFYNLRLEFESKSVSYMIVYYCWYKWQHFSWTS